jgi:hypothetical protein
MPRLTITNQITVALFALSSIKLTASALSSCGSRNMSTKLDTIDRLNLEVSACNMKGYFAFEPGAFLKDGSSENVPLLHYPRAAAKMTPVSTTMSTTSCLFSTGCARFRDGGLKMVQKDTAASIIPRCHVLRGPCLFHNGIYS